MKFISLKKTMCIVSMSLVLFIFFCGITANVAMGVTKVVKVPDLYTKPGLYDAMWDAAINQGYNMGFSVEREDKRHGELRFVKEVGTNKYYIRVAFGKIDGETGFLVEASTKNDLINPFVFSDANSMKNAIEAARSPETSSEKKMAKIDMSFKSTKSIEPPSTLGPPIKIANYLPPAGQKATYQVQVRWTPTEKKQISWQYIADTLEKRTLNDKQVVPRRRESTNAKTGQKSSSLAYYVLDETGYYRYAEQKEDMVEPKILDSPFYTFKAPFALNASWEQQGNTILMRTKIPVSYVVIVDKIDDIVTVPAGSFENCLRVKFSCEVTNSKNQRVNIEGYDWYAPGVGYVKEIRKEKPSDPAIGDEGTMTTQLSSVQK